MDCNNFYVSCERLFNPKLINKPVIVLSNNDGCVISRSEEAKNIGIKMGEPFFKIKNIIKRGDVFVLSSNYSFYGDISNRIMNILKKNLAIVEIYSIDEAFFLLDLKNQKEKFCYDLAKKILKWTGIPVSIGIAKTKTLAKIANRVVKKKELYPGLNMNFNNVLSLESDKSINYVLRETQTQNIWGIGKQLANFLSINNVNNAFQLKELNQNFARKKKGLFLQRSILELNGIKCIDIENNLSEKKSICVSRSFGKKLNCYEDIKSALIVYTQKATSKMRSYNFFCRSITIFLKTSKYQSKIYSNHKTYSLLEATNDTRIVWKISEKLLQKIYKENFFYSKAGIIISDFSINTNIQQELIKDRELDINHQKESSAKLMKVMDYVNKKFGDGKLRLSTDKNGSFYLNKKNVNWLMKSEYRSPCYTTNWCDIPKVRI